MLRILRVLRLRLQSLLNPRQTDQLLDEELQFHLDKQIEVRIAEGLSPDDARYAALRDMGAITQNKERCRDARGISWVETLLQDLRYGVRTLRANPSFSLAACLALALGIGANTAMFSVAYGVLLRPLPYPHAERAGVISMSYGPRDNAYGTMCMRDYQTWVEHNHVFEELGLFRSNRADIVGSGPPEQLSGATVTAGFFSTFGVRPLLGRTFAASEDKPGAASLAVLSETLWRRRFGANPNIIGQTLQVNGAASTVIGVLPADFQLPRRDTEIWTNLLLIPPTRYGPWFFRGVGRLKHGVSTTEMDAELNAIAELMVQQNPAYKRVTLPFRSLRDTLVGNGLKPALVVLAGAVGLVLLIAMVNVANLMLARASVRQREMALRLSLGAERSRLVRQLLTESVLLAAAGGILGLGIATASVEFIRRWNPGNLPLIDAVQLDWTALVFMVVVSILTGILFGLAPALQASRADLNSAMKDTGGRSGTATRKAGRARAALVVSEIALSLVLLAGAGLLFRSFLNLQRVNNGFFAPSEEVLTVLISPSDPKYAQNAAGIAFYDEVLRRVRTLPGVEAAAITDSLPPDREGDADTFQIEGQLLAPGEINPVVTAVTTSPDYFTTLGVPLVAGRSFTEHDVATSAPVVIVSEAFARRFFPGQRAIGKRIRQREPWMEIIGVAGNVKYRGVNIDSSPAYYMPAAQNYGRRMFLAARSSGDAATTGTSLRREIQQIDPTVTVSPANTIAQAMDTSLARPKFNTMLLSLFAGIALTLAAIGIYGLIAYSVAQRTREIGLRMALGAAPSEVLALVLRQGAILAVLGITAGLAGAFILTRLLETMLFGIGVTDATTFVAASAGILLLVLLATAVPALRATRISPVVALSYE